MPDEQHLRRKLTLKAYDQQVVFVKRAHERIEHVLMKAFLWALYLPRYPDLTVEVGIGGKYKPDVVSTDRYGAPIFWGEAGSVGAEKLATLLRRYARSHLAFAKWNTRLDPFEAMVREGLESTTRFAPVDLLRFPDDSRIRFIDERERINISHDDLDWLRIDP